MRARTFTPGCKSLAIARIAEIEGMWKADVARFREQRRPYLLYRE